MLRVRHTCRYAEAASSGCVGAYRAGPCSRQLSILAVADAHIHSCAVQVAGTLHARLAPSKCSRSVSEDGQIVLWSDATRSLQSVSVHRDIPAYLGHAMQQQPEGQHSTDGHDT